MQPAPRESPNLVQIAGLPVETSLLVARAMHLKFGACGKFSRTSGQRVWRNVYSSEKGASMRAVCVALVFAGLVPATARAEPISVTVASAVGGFSQQGTSVNPGALNLGTILMPSAGAVGTLLFAGLSPNIPVSFMLEGLGRFDTLILEVLNPAGTNNQLDPTQPNYTPAGYSTSNNLDGLSFAQSSGLERSAVFAGGIANVFADEWTHRGDVLMFSGLAGAESARVTFGLRNTMRFFGQNGGVPGFLLRISAADPVAAPEPASMVLLGTGLVGLIAARRRRRAVSGR